MRRNPARSTFSMLALAIASQGCSSSRAPLGVGGANDGGPPEDASTPPGDASADAGDASSPLPLPLSLVSSPAEALLTLNWMDRRPIGQIVLGAGVSGAGAHNDGFGAGNPRGWFGDHAIDIQQALSAFQKKLLGAASGAIPVLQSVQAQGVIIWDVEGEEYPQQTTYIGDPTLVPQMAPELESIVNLPDSPYNGMKLIDAYFKSFTDAGLRVGVTVRAQQMEFNNTADCNSQDLLFTCQPFLTDLSKMAQILTDKIAYARQRWGATLFYSDSSVVADQAWSCWPPDCNNNPATCPTTCPGYPSLLLPGGRSRMGSSAIPHSVFQSVADANPDVLIIPEEHEDAYYQRVSPLFQLFQTGSNAPHTSAAIAAMVPGAFSTYIIDNAGLSQGSSNYADLVIGARMGDVMILGTWYDTPDQQLAVSIRQAALGAGITPAVIPVGAVKALTLGASVTLQWTTSNPATDQVVYGTTPSYGASSAPGATLAKTPAVKLESLQAATTYHVSVRSQDAFGNVAASPDLSFTTP